MKTKSSYLHVFEHNSDVSFLLVGELRGEVVDGLGDPEAGEGIFLLKLDCRHCVVCRGRYLEVKV